VSHELFELFGMLGAGVSLTALLHRALHPIRLRFATSPADPIPPSARECQPDAGIDSNGASPRGAELRRPDSAT
jgi:hypothetical protein